MKKDDYIEAIAELLDDGKDFDDVIKNTKKILEKKGHQRLYRSIVVGLLKKVENSLKTQGAVVSVAREKDLKLLKAKISSSLKEIDSKDYQTNTDPTLVGGYTIEHDNKIIDNSYKSRLVTLYRSLIE